MKGHHIPHSIETKQKISQTKLGKTSPKKGKKFPEYSGENSKSWKGGKPNCKVCGIKLCSYANKTCLRHRDMAEISRKIVEKRIKGNNYIAWNKGMKGFNAGSYSPNWKGGITPINNKIRGSLEYKLWQDSIFNRDGNSCQKCGELRISKLVAHHILNFSKYIELRFAIDNGITFCRSCHKIFHKKYGVKNNTSIQVNQFLTL